MVDTHCHLTLKDTKSIENMGKNLMIVSSTNEFDLDETISLTQKYKNIYATIGIHPEYADSYDLAEIEKNLMNPKIVGIGEIGLDYHYREDNKKQQKILFEKQIQLAKKYNKTIVIHSRDALEDTYNILKKYPDIKKVMHCFSGTIEMAKRLIEINTKLGVGGILTFKNENNLKKIVKEIKLENFLLETDSPYLSPEPLRGTKNEPKNILIVANKIAEIKGETLDCVLNTTTNSAISQFDLKN